MLREKSPVERIKDIEKAFLDYTYPFQNGRRKKGILAFVILLFLVFVVSASAFVFIFEPTIQFKGKKKQTEEKDVIRKEMSDKKVCSISTPYDASTAKMLLDLGVKSIRIISDRSVRRNDIKFFVGDFKDFQDAAIVSSRLNDKALPNRIEKVKDSWRVYIVAEIPEIQGYVIKLNITPDDISHMEKVASSRFGEIVRVEVLTREVLMAKMVFELETKEDCDRFVKLLKVGGKSVEAKYFIKS